MDYFRFAIALAPLGMYWILSGYLYKRKYPMLINAAQDTLLLGMGILGWIVIGPMELFFPAAAYSVLGIWTWFFLVCLYAFVVLFVALNRRPHWTVYGMTPEQLQGVMTRVLESEAIDHAWMDSVLQVPEFGVRGTVEAANKGGHSTQFSPCGSKQDPLGWHRFERLVNAELHSQPSVGGGTVWVAAGLFTIVAAVALFSVDLDRIREIWTELAGVASE